MKNIPDYLLKGIPEISAIWDRLPNEAQSLWNDVQESLSNTLIIPRYFPEQSRDDYLAGVDLSKLDLESRNMLGYSYLFTIYLPKDVIKSFDVAHELAHIAVVSMRGYSYLLDTTNSRTQSEYLWGLVIRDIYSAAIHPVVDSIVKDSGLFSEEFYERKLESIQLNLDQAAKLQYRTKETMIVSLSTILEAKHRLPANMYANVLRWVERLGIGEILAYAEKIPLYNFDCFNDPSKLNSTLLDTYSRIGLDYRSLSFSLLNKNHAQFK